MKPSCRSYRRAFLLGEAGTEVSNHLTECAQCSRFRDRELATSNLVRQHRPLWRAPAGLRHRVTTAMASARRETVESRGPGRRRLLLAAALLAATALIAGVAVTQLTGGTEHTMAQREAQLTTDYVIKDHLEFARGRDRHADLITHSPEQVRAYFEREVSLAVRIPELEGATLTGARRCNVRGRPAALVFYERAVGDGVPEPLSLFVFEKRGEDFSAMDEIEGMPGKRTCHHSARGVGVIMWEERGLVYAITAALETHELGDLFGR